MGSLDDQQKNVDTNYFVNNTVKKKLKTFSSPIKNMINVSIDENTGPQSIMLNSTSV